MVGPAGRVLSYEKKLELVDMARLNVQGTAPELLEAGWQEPPVQFRQGSWLEIAALGGATAMTFDAIHIATLLPSSKSIPIQVSPKEPLCPATSCTDCRVHLPPTQGTA